MTDTVVAVGAGQVSAVLARTLRRRKFDGRIVLVGAEPHRPYQRPPLSKEYLVDGDDEDLYLLPEQWCADKDVELLLGTPVTGLDVAGRSVTLADGRTIGADAIVLATGGRARRLPDVEGDRILYLRTLDDAGRLDQLLQPGARLVVVGGGFIGSEVAAAGRARGAEVTLVEMLEQPLARVLGTQLGAVCAQVHVRGGVQLRLGQPVESIVQSGDVVRVRVGDETLEADVVVVGVGIEPNVELADAAGLKVDNGIVVDEQLRTGAPGIYAAGDVANVHHPLYGKSLRVEHFDAASKQGAVVANNILGRESTFADPYWFWSDQYDLNLQYTGHATSWDRVVLRGSLDDLAFTAFYLEDGVVRAAFAIERGDDIAAAGQLVAAQARPDPEALADVDTDLFDLLEGE